MELRVISSPSKSPSPEKGEGDFKAPFPRERGWGEEKYIIQM